jgi:UDP-glucose 4-epimerase
MTWEGQTVLVTGGAGFLGSNLVDALVEAGASVRVLDNLHSGHESNLDDMRDHVDLRIADLRDRDAVSDAVKGCSSVFHLGANSSVPFSVEDREYDFGTNVTGTWHVADAVIRHDVERVVFTSTAAVYGTPVYTPVDEKHPLDPVSPYGASKLAGERLLFAYSPIFNFDLTIVRIFNTFGPRQRHYVIYDLMQKLKRNPDRLEVLGSGNQLRDYCFVSDMVAGLMLAAGVASSPAQVVNISGGRTVSIRELTALIVDTLGLENTEVEFGLPSWEGDIDVLSGDISRIKGLGFSPTVPFEEGLRRMAQHLGMID